MAIWHCYKQRCFTTIATDLEKVDLFKELKTIHTAAEEIFETLRVASTVPEMRRKGVRGSSVECCAHGAQDESRVGV